MQTQNPADETLLKKYPLHSPVEVERLMRQAQEAQREWSTWDFKRRAEVLRRCGELLRERSDLLGRLVTLEMGKPLREARKEVAKCATACDYYAEHGARFLADEERTGDTRKSYVTYSPLGIVLAIMPWNFPFWQVFRCAAPTVMAGNALLVKHAPNVTGCAQAIEAVCKESGFPEGLIRSLIIETEECERLIGDPRIAAVTLTGSGRAGRAVATQAGAHLKKTVLELGGSDPFIVLEDADLDEAITGALTGRLMNAGQSCISSKRFFLHESQVDFFCKRIEDALTDVSLGNPIEATCDIGPLARKDLRDALHSQVVRSIDAGAKLVSGGIVPDRKGWYYPPTLLRDVCPGMPAFDEETFGPVFAVIAYSSVDEVVRLVNQSRYGLGASIWTSQPEKAIDLARRIQAGAVFINSNVHSHPGIPFGGMKESGYGRELSREGMLEFVNIKAICVA